MIQDIAPDFLKNEYEPCEPQPGDWIFWFRGKEILVQQAAFERGKCLIFPKYGETESNSISVQNRSERNRVDRKKMNQECKNPIVEDDLQGKLQYLFRMSGQACFLYQEPEGEKKSECPDGWIFVPVRSLRFVKQNSACMAGATAYHLWQWYRDNRFCGRCGNIFRHGEKERMLFCPHCGNIVFPKISPAVIVAVIDPETERIVMTKYADRDFKKYALIAGFTEIGETAEQTVEREVMEEVGLSVKNITYYKSQPWGFDSNLLMGFFAELSGSNQITREERELSVAEWMPREQLADMDDGISLTREMMGEFYRRGNDVLCIRYHKFPY